MGSVELPENNSLYLEREPVAIVGTSCRFPGGATSPSKLWDLLQKPRNVLNEIPPSRFNTSAFYHPDSQHHGSTNTKHAYLLQDDPRAFDRDFFSISPKEAEAMDPQQRVLLETVYEGVEATGYSLQQLRGSSTAVFVGCMSYDYQFTGAHDLDSLPQYHATGTAASILANRLSYFYDWRGPSVSLDTACSSSLVALHQAVSALRNGEASMAVAAGSNLIIGPEVFVRESKLNMLSPNGRSAMWDVSADGYTRGEGFAAVFLKTLSQAIADGDHIECIIRETGVNSDGKTPGITMPSSESQARLIRETYARAGLDPLRASDRPQYFEAHGTGTQAGDPIEARAIQSVFFPNEEDGQLIVGSIKTVIGHTEGTAGVAGIIKASLAVQHGQIPANLHFNQLNPKVEPYYSNLRIPTETMPWPAVPAGSPRRVSVNSFGFGGTNAHAIIESWNGPGSEDAAASQTLNTSRVEHAGPFVLSANSSQALTGSAAALATYLRGEKVNEPPLFGGGSLTFSHLRAHPDIDLSRLVSTLFQRTDFPFRAAFSATSAGQLADKLEAAKDSLKNSPRTATVSETLPPRILGVFTGQGAQWATMGKELYAASIVFRNSIDEMQDSLNSLPEKDRPDWSLVDQLGAPKALSRVGEAVVSQPLCTALQVALVDVLRAVGVEFSAVVGHSSGEIAAAYAAGYINSVDAIRIAYYRGVHAHLAQGPGGKRGKMMAVGMSFGQATAFCNEPEFGRALVVAASNSQTSCTLAGNAEAIDAAHARLQEKGTFARVLQVDTAYHSHHMKACGVPYLESMKQAGVKVQKSHERGCRWYSSVWGPNGRSRSFDGLDGQLLTGQYWVDNMTQAVLFSQALSRALNEDQCFDAVLEVGPHPALKGPSAETIKMLTGQSLPYAGVLQRGHNAMEAFADCLGFLWKSFPSSRPIITFAGLRRVFKFPGGNKAQRLPVLKDLPVYSWDHLNLIWKEPRAARIFRARSSARHELLGHSVTHGERDKREVHWKQLLKVNELPWLAGHKVQGEILFPASGYLSMAYEAAIRLVDEEQQPLRLVELHDVDIARAMRLEEDSSGLEVLFIVRVTGQSEECITAEVACYSGAVDAVQPLDAPQASLTSHFTGGVRLWLGQPSKDALPRRTQPLLPMDPLNVENLYSSLSREGFSYSGPFQAKSMLRRLNQAVVTVSSPPHSPSSIRPCMHPAILDTAFHGVLAGFSFPGDGRLGTIYLPTRVDCIRISMVSETSGLEMHETSALTADATVTATGKNTLTGEVNLFSSGDAHTQVQIRGAHMTAIGQRRDPWLYAGTTWARQVDYGIEPAFKANVTEADWILYEQLNRTAFFYLRELKKKILPQELFLMSKLRRHMISWAFEYLIPQIEAGEHSDIRAEWKDDTPEMVEMWRASQPPDNIHMNLLHAMGKSLVPVVRGTVPALRVLTQDDMLDRLYVEGLGAWDTNIDLGVMVKQLAHQHPRMRICEVGAGTGGATGAVLNALGNQYASYMYTDISTAFFDRARTVFSQHTSKLAFKTLNIENDPVEQGFAEGAYDMVLSANCLHATRSLGETLRHCRRLLRPGGRLVLLEITRDFLPIQLLMAPLPGWWAGIDDGRVWSPTVSLPRWDELLKASGFSGVDVSSTPSYCSVIVAQAVDETVQLLREPLAVTAEVLPPVGDILIVSGGDTSSKLASQTQAVLQQNSPSKTVKVLSGLEGIQVLKGAVVLCLGDLDSPVFHGMNQERFKGLQDLMATAGTVLWVTAGAKSGKSPEANITSGLSSTLWAERTDIKLQFLDVDDPSSLDPSTLAKLLLRLAFTDPSKSQFDDLLWIQEPELAWKDGALYIPRVLPLDTVNRRSAASRRQITQATTIRGSTDTAVEIKDRQGIFELQVEPLFDGSTNIPEDEVRLQVMASSLRPLTGDWEGPSFVCIGRDLQSNDMVIALSSEANRSVVTVVADHVLHRWQYDQYQVTENDASRHLHLYLARALAENVLSGLEGPVWIHGVPVDVSDAVTMAAREKAISLFQTTSDINTAKAAYGVSFLHPYASEGDLHNLGSPKDLRSFVNLEESHQETTHLLRAFVPASAVMNRNSDSLTAGFKLDELTALAKEHLGRVEHILDELARIRIVAIDQVSTLASKDMGATTVVDWRSADTVNALVSPLKHHGLFAPNKTYLLFGMTGDLGISVCLWMVENGARNVVLTSRKPNVAPSVLEYLSLKGAHVRPMAVDVTDQDSLRTAYADIRSSMPPIGGVMNAAMVLRDRLFQNMSWHDFAAVLAPKVTGSRNIDEIFGDAPLDFFICFSSTTAIVGSIGQSAYAAANHYMASLIQRRRNRGLAGSVIHIAILTGFGYIFRRDSDHADTINKALLSRADRQSETDLHEMLAEAIVCGRPGSGQQTSELITGIRTDYQSDWRDDPRLSCYVGGQQELDDSDRGQGAGSISVKAQLEAVENGDPVECLAVLERCFGLALGNLLEVDPEQLDTNMPVTSLGIDSLVAIRIREWFLKELSVDVPVLKVMSDSYSISRMCDDVLVDWRRLNKA